MGKKVGSAVSRFCAVMLRCKAHHTPAAHVAPRKYELFGYDKLRMPTESQSHPELPVLASKISIRGETADRVERSPFHEDIAASEAIVERSGSHRLTCEPVRTAMGQLRGSVERIHVGSKLVKPCR